jgi:hypothetical protein
MTPCVPGHRADSITGLNTQRNQCMGKFLNSKVRFSVIGSVYWAFNAARNDWTVAVICGAMLHQGYRRKRAIHHQTINRQELLPKRLNTQYMLAG